MTQSKEPAPRASRRGFLAATAGLAAGSVAGCLAPATAAEALGSAGATRAGQHPIVPFWGKHQSGIVTPAQPHTYFASFDLVTTQRDEVVEMLRQWTSAAARMSTGQPADQPRAEGAPSASADSGDVLDLPPSRLTLTFGFGAQLFIKDGKDRYGLAVHRPEALVDMPIFTGDQLVPTRTGGDLSVQACADDPQVAFHAVRQLARLAGDVAQIRWVQTGFIAAAGASATPRNLMGFKDGTANPPVADPGAMDQFVWVGSEGPDWMRGGSYLVARRSRIALEHWDRMSVAFQEQTFGRSKLSGAPLGKKSEFDPLDLEATDHEGNPVVPENSHVRLGHHTSNEGARILRRSYSYNDGVNFTAERWPPWRQGLEYDAGLFFVCYQRDPRSGFIRIFERMSKFDMMNQFVTNTGSGLFACPAGIDKGGFIGQRLFEAAL